jgi:putative ABC transport system ATP-binding protein
MSRPPVVEATSIVAELGQGAGRVKALKGVSLTIHPGELTLLMGPSGSGKTTLLSIIGCILTPTAGALSIAGQSTEGLDPEALAALRRRHIGFVFQSYNLFPTLTALENVRLALDVRGMGRWTARRTAREALIAVGLEHRLHAYPRTMSGGEQQRVAIARAIAGRPSLVLADEPTAALDAENGQAVMALLAQLARDESRAVLAVTHDHRTLEHASRVIKIEDGRIIDDGRRKPMIEPIAVQPARAARTAPSKPMRQKA